MPSEAYQRCWHADCECLTRLKPKRRGFTLSSGQPQKRMRTQPVALDRAER